MVSWIRKAESFLDGGAFCYGFLYLTINFRVDFINCGGVLDNVLGGTGGWERDSYTMVGR
jgi:hypothetical protein